MYYIYCLQCIWFAFKQMKKKGYWFAVWLWRRALVWLTFAILCLLWISVVLYVTSICSFTNICLTKFYFDWMIMEKIACFILSMLSDDGQLSNPSSWCCLLCFWCHKLICYAWVFLSGGRVCYLFLLHIEILIKIFTMFIFVFFWFLSFSVFLMIFLFKYPMHGFYVLDLFLFRN